MPALVTLLVVTFRPRRRTAYESGHLNPRRRCRLYRASASSMMGYAAVGRLDLVHLDGLALELLVVLEEAAQHREPVRRHLGGLLIAVELRVVVATAMILWSFLPESIIVISPIVRA